MRTGMWAAGTKSLEGGEEDLMQVYGGSMFPVYGWNFVLWQAIQTTQVDGNLSLEFPGVQATTDAELNYRLLDTDYENYSIVY